MRLQPTTRHKHVTQAIYASPHPATSQPPPTNRPHQRPNKKQLHARHIHMPKRHKPMPRHQHPRRQLLLNSIQLHRRQPTSTILRLKPQQLPKPHTKSLLQPRQKPTKARLPRIQENTRHTNKPTKHTTTMHQYMQPIPQTILYIKKQMHHNTNRQYQPPLAPNNRNKAYHYY